MRSPKLEQWLEDSVIREALLPTLERNYVDLDPTFNMHVDEDFDHRMSGISRNSFCNAYLEWIQYCASRRDKVSSQYNYQLFFVKSFCNPQENVYTINVLFSDRRLGKRVDACFTLFWLEYAG